MAIVPQLRHPLESLRDRLHAALDRFRPGSRREDDRGEGGSLARPAFSGPALDVEETDEAILVRAELPGLQPQDFTVEATADRLIIRGQKSEEHEEQGRGFYRVERRAGAFVRSVPLPAEVDPDRVTATHRDGVLRLNLPKTETAKARRVRVNIGGG